jgi:hypothetical protein
MHLLGVNGDNGETMSSLFRRVQLNKNSIPSSKHPYTNLVIVTYEIKPLLDYCINHPYIGDVLLFKVPLHEHPWGVNTMLCIEENNHAQFKDWTICLHKVEQSMFMYVHIGGWWIKSNHDNIEMSFFLVVHHIPMKNCGKS